MSQYLYDEAIVEKVKRWTKYSDIHVYGPEETERMFGVNADIANDRPIELPLITISRDRGFVINNEGRTRRPLSYDGLTLFANAEKSKILNAIPIAMDYTINIYTKFQKESDILARNLIFNIVNQPALKVEIPDTDSFDGESFEPFVHTARIELASNQIQDRSNIKERFIEGNFTKLSLIVTVDDAYLWDVREHINGEIEFDIETIYEPVQLIYKSDKGGAPDTKYIDSPPYVLRSYDLPVLITKGYKWGGWYYEKDFKTQAKAGDLIEHNTVLYAKFIAKTTH